MLDFSNFYIFLNFFRLFWVQFLTYKVHKHTKPTHPVLTRR